MTGILSKRSLQASLSLGGCLHTGMPAHPVWCKAQETTTENKALTSEINDRRRYFFDIHHIEPGYNAGFYNVHQMPSQQVQPINQPNMVGFFDALDKDPALAGFIRVLGTNKNYNKIPT